MKNKIETIDDLLNEICKKNSIYDIIIDNIIAPNYDLKLPLISEIAISFLQNEGNIMKKYRQGEFRYYFARVVINQVKSKTSPLHRNHRSTLNDLLGDKRDWDSLPEVYDDETEIDLKIDKELRLRAFRETKHLSWYESEICKMYFEQGYSTRQIEKIDGIDHMSVWLTIREFKNRVKQTYEELKNNE